MQLERGTQLGDYEIREPVGSGGMGEVYRARDTRLDRDVAIKVLPREVADDPSRRARFDREAKSVAALNHENIVTIHTIGEDGGVHYLAMELVEGETLDRQIPENGLSTEALLALAVPISAALAAAHAKGIIHRDLKPANVMVTGEGKVKVLDFGLAKLTTSDDEPLEPIGEQSETATMTLQTRAGTIVGTMPYMSPEQLSGRAVGPASDLFSLGVILYEMATGKRPFQGSTGPTLISSILTETPQPVGDLSPALPNALGELIERCLAKDPLERPDGAAEVGTELESLRERSSLSGIDFPSRARRVSRWQRVVVGVALLAVISATAIWYGGRAKKARWARNVAVPEIQGLFDEGQRMEAFRLLREARQSIPDDPVLAALEATNTLPSSVETDPPGADVFINNYLDPDQPWMHLGTTPIEVALPITQISYRIELPGYETYLGTGIEMRAAPVELIKEGAAPPGMVRIPAGREAFRDLEPVAVNAFWLDRYEVTNEQFKEFVDAGGYRNAEYWKEPIVVNGQVVALEEALEHFSDTTGRPGPDGWELGSYPDGQSSYPVGGVSWYEAAAYAAWAGKSLPTAFHWFRAAEQGIFSDIVMVSNIDGKGPAAVGTFQGVGPYGTFDMAGNVREWSLNASRDLRYVLGGGWPEPRYEYSNSRAEDPMDRAPKNGFRCMQTDGPIAPETMAAVEVPVYDFRQTEPVGDEVYRVLEGFFAYDRTELDAEIEDVDDSSEHWRRERVNFRAAYGDERVPAYLYLPKSAKPPFQTVVYFPSSIAHELDNSRNPPLFVVSLIIRSGRALMYPIYKGTFERRIESWGPNATRDLVIQASKDMRRSVDYLESRDDIDSDKLAYCGLSWGGSWGPMFTAIEDRFKASVLLAGGMARYPPDRPPESIPANFMPRSRVPVLMVNGREDFTNPVETELIPMFELQGAPAEHKRLVLLDGGHVPDSPKEFVRAALDWLDLYLGPVQ